MAPITSMTGLGEAAGSLSPRLTARVRAWSVNSKSLDLFLRITPKGDFPEVEIALRKLVAERLHRGRVTLAVELKNMAGEGSLRLNWDLARQLQAELAQAREILDISALSLRDLVSLPGFCEIPETTLEEQEQQALVQLAAQALEELKASRAKEGSLLLPAIQQELQNLAAFVVFLQAKAQDLRQALFTRLKEKLAALLSQGVDEQRLLQEAAVLAERADVTEEQTRLAAHLQHFDSLLKQGGPVGRKLDFLVQEMLREINTAAAKLREVGMGEQVVEAKASLERVREQVANLE